MMDGADHEGYDDEKAGYGDGADCAMCVVHDIMLFRRLLLGACMLSLQARMMMVMVLMMNGGDDDDGADGDDGDDGDDVGC